MARLISPTGAAVDVDDAKADGLLSRGFAREEAKKSATKKAAAKKAPSSSSK